MINIRCEDKYLKKSIINLLLQKKLSLNTDENEQSFFTIKITMRENNLEFSLGDKKIIFKLPKSFNEIFEDLYELISNESIHIQNHDYYPFKQLIKKNEKNIFLSEIQNTIMSNLLLNSSDGIKKIDLIKTIWPNDKDIFFNKLDTHLTNLKNYLKSESDFDLKFTSKSGLIKLIFN